MKRAILTPPDLAGALADLKQWLAITGAGEDDALTALLGAALDTCEAFTGAMPLAAGCEEVHPAHREWLALAARPVQAIAGIAGIPAEGPRFALAPDAYEIELDADGGCCARARPGGSRCASTRGSRPAGARCPKACATA